MQQSQQLPIDAVSRGLIVVDFEHHEIHAGDHYDVSDLRSLSNGATFDYLLTTPNTAKRIHFLFGLDTDAKATIALYESPTASGGTALTPYNNNRDSANTATLIVTHTPTVSAVGTLIDIHMSGSGEKAGGDKRDSDEWVLKTNTQYLVRLTAYNAMQAVTHLDWYEH